MKNLGFVLQEWEPLVDLEWATVLITANSLSTHWAFRLPSAFQGCGKGRGEPTLPGHQENERAHSPAQSPF